VFLVLITLVAISEAITAFKLLFEDWETEFLRSLPSSEGDVVFDRLAMTYLYGAWVALLFGIPLLVAYTRSLGGGIAPGLLGGMLLVFLLMIPASFAFCTALLLSLIILPQQGRRLVVAFVIAVGAGLYILLMMLKAELFLNPRLVSAIDERIYNLQMATSIYMPNVWLAKAVKAGAEGEWRKFCAYANVIVATGCAAFVGAFYLGKALYERARTRYEEGRRVSPAARRRFGGRLVEKCLGKSGIVLMKDGLTFARDPSQWGQALLIVVLAGMYMMNLGGVRVGTDTRFWEVFRVSLMLGASSYILATLGLRFLYPAISLEGRRMWAIYAGDGMPEALLLHKFLGGALGLSLLGVVLVIGGGLAFKMGLEVLLINALLIICIAVGLSAINVGFGAILPHFETDNPIVISSSIGGMVSVIASMVFAGIIVVTNGVRLYKMPQGGWLWIAGAVLFAGMVTLLFIRIGLKALSELDMP